MNFYEFSLNHKEFASNDMMKTLFPNLSTFKIAQFLLQLYQYKLLQMKPIMVAFEAALRTKASSIRWKYTCSYVEYPAELTAT